MTTSYKQKAQRLHETASAQGGYFTTKQAAAAGYAASTHSYNIKAGNWVREHRGIYRLANYPNPDHPDLITWSLWSSNRKGEPQGIYSHQTALSIYDLSDLNPPKIHMTVPSGFRRNSAIPEVLILHRGVFKKHEVESMHGFKVARPLRAIADLLREETVELDHMRQAVRQAFQRGILSKGEIEQSHLPEEMKKRILQFREKV
ncbi:MAG: hypothetical protein CO113_03355 [Elusimicrobia bacterium CG_4_9_14_3_um_filter_62_55]|nr:MAG: hypothetical protein CO113_03355 [Elusimicrobia bacterium CG_4_9_14_3_um_filter_62_55]